MYHDNQRKIIEKIDFKEHDLSQNLFDSKHLLNKTRQSNEGVLSKFPFTLAYTQIPQGRAQFTKT
jgi:hypothetical protein